jgi:hypothetical protein
MVIAFKFNLLKIFTNRILLISILYSFFILAFFIFYVFVLGKDSSFFLGDDGYYTKGKMFFNGGSLLGQYTPPLFSLLLSVLNFFPVEFHSFLRIIITLFFVNFNIFIAKLIFQNVLSHRIFSLGLFLALFNPLFIHWTIKSTPEVYVTFFIGLLILFLIKYSQTKQIKYIFIYCMILFLATNFKPVFLFIPLTFLSFAIIKWNRKLIVLSAGGLIYLIVIQLLTLSYSKPEGDTKREYGRADLIASNFLVETMIETGKFEFGSNTGLMINSPNESNLWLILKKYSEWEKIYITQNPNSSLLKTFVDFSIENPTKVIITRLVAPILFISLSSSTAESLSNLFINLFIVFCSIYGIKEVFKKEPNVLLCVLLTLAGYFLTFFISFSYARYSVPVLFYLSFLASPKIYYLYNSYLKSKFSINPFTEKVNAVINEETPK